MKRFAKKSDKSKDPKFRNKPLEKQLEEDTEIKPKNRVKRRKNTEENDEDDNVINQNISSKILAQAREQMYEEENEEDNREREAVRSRKVKFNKVETHSDDEDNFSDHDEEEYNPAEWEEDINEDDERAMEMFMSKEAPKRLTLADIIMEKLQEREQQQNMEQTLEEQLATKLDPKIVQVYNKIGILLNRYKSGRIPKAFKMIPSLSNWEEIVYLTKPEEWSSQATRQATRLFASNLNSKMAQRFYNLILLPKIRYDIQMNKKLNFHLYFSLKKALYKPAAFYKGLLLPLCEARDCTLREAAVISSLLAKVSIPILHSSVAILKISEMEYSGACSFFLRVLLNKKYALPYRVVDAVVNHFAKFIDDDRKLPLLWHQSLLIFVQRYKTDLLPEQKDILRTVIKKQPHYYFTEEVRRELNNSKSRGEEANAPVAELDMDLDE